MGRCVDGVVFHRGEHIEPRLLEAQAHPSSAREQVDPRRPPRRQPTTRQISWGRCD